MVRTVTDNDIVLGIDLGTSNSAACVYIDGEPNVIKSSEGSMYGSVFPSYVSFTDKEILVGELAKKQFKTNKNAENTVRAIKKDMGTDKKMMFRGELYSPQQISGFILQKIKHDAEKQLGKPVKKAVITVPANFNDNQRTATKDAGRIAGLEVEHLINEPTAACLAYGIDNLRAGPQKILVFDLGGGTLDVTIMRFAGKSFKVLSTSGELNLGGTNMDNNVFKYLQDEFKKQHGKDLPNNKKTKNRLLDAAERAKIDLSTSLQANIDMEIVTLGADGFPIELEFSTTLTRSKLEELVTPIVEECSKPIQKALDDANLTKRDIDKLILVGGPTKMPIVQEYVEKFMEKPAVTGIDPMQCVAHGAAIKAGIETGEIEGFDVWDVTPLSLGIRSKGGITEFLIKRNSKIPVVKSKRFRTTKDNQRFIRVEIVQGENKMASDNAYLGNFILDVKPAPKGKVIVEITYKIDNNGILNVTATDKTTGNKKSLTLDSPNQMTEDEVDEAIRIAEENRKNNEKREKLALMKNEADDVIYSAQKLINSNGLSFGDKVNIESLIDNLNESISGENNLKIKQSINNLKKAISNLK